MTVEEVYNWRDDIMEIAHRVVYEMDEARLNNIAEHFDVDLSEIREFLEMKRNKMQKPQTNADKIRAMTDEELANILTTINFNKLHPKDKWLEWLREEAEQ